MSGNISSEYGNIVIDNEVIAKYAGQAAIDCFGIVGMASISVKEGIATLLRGDSSTKGINVKIDVQNNIDIDFHIIVAYGVSIRTVVSNLIKTVRYQIEEMTDMKVKNINVYVEGVRVID